MAGRPPFSFYLIDLPGDHEVDEGLSTECEVIRAILSNRGFRSVTKTARITTARRFKTFAWKPYSGVGYVHLATHGLKSGKGIGLIGGNVDWVMVANSLKRIAPPLSGETRRVLCLSCCYSEAGYQALKPLLRKHFTGCYYFSAEEIEFADAITNWAMFYKKKTISRPHRAVVEQINGFFGEELLQFGLI